MNSNRSGLPFVIIICIAYIAIQLITASNYPVFRDELYYLDCANHPAFGYVDQPPVSIIILTIWKAIFGDSLLSIRILPALLGACLIFLTALISRALGGGKGAQIFAGVSACSGLVYYVLGGYYSMNAFDFVFWALLFYVFIKIINTQNPKLWMTFGIIAGLGLMNKISVLYFGAGLVAAMIFTKERTWFRNKYFYFGGFIALLVFLPYIIWNFTNDFATIQFIKNATTFKNESIPLLDFVKEQILDLNPLNFFVWFTGIIALIFSSKLKKYRVIAFTYIAIFVILTVQKSKPYYLVPAYSVLLGAGAVAITEFFDSKRLAALKYVFGSLMIIVTCLLSPIVVPVLQPSALADYLDKVGIRPKTGENSKEALFPQYFADRFGWEEMTEKVAKAYDSLPPEERKYTAIFGQNYGEAGAIDYYGRNYGLPQAISGHNSHWLWGYGSDSINTVIVIGDKKEKLESLFNSVTLADTTNCSYAMPFENHLPIFICRGMKKSFKEIWPELKKFI